MKMKRISRRACLKAGAAFMILPCTSARGYAANERLDVACVGVGGMGRGNHQRLHKIGENIVALCDVDSRNLDAAAKEYPGARTWADFREMLDKQKNIDAVMVSTPDHTHAVVSMAAMKRGKHVCCEKPLAHSIHELHALAAAAKQYKVTTQVDAEGHAFDGLRQIVERIRAGVIGPVQEVHIWRQSTYRPNGWPERPKRQPIPSYLDWDLWLGPAPYRDYHEGLHPGAWRRWWDFGSGVLGDWCGHLFDAAVWALDLGGPFAIQPQWGGDVADVPPEWAIIRYTFPPYRGRPAVMLTWYEGQHEAKPPRPEELKPGEELPTGGYLFVGTQGKMLVRGRNLLTESDQAVLLPEEKEKTFQPPAPSLPRVRNEDHLLEWIKACKGGEPTSLPFDGYGSRLFEIGLLGVAAVRAGKKIEWDTTQPAANHAAELAPYVRPQYRKGWEL